MRWGLRARVLVILVVAVAVAGLAVWLVTAWRLRDTIALDLQRRAEVIGRALDASLDVALALETKTPGQAEAFLIQLVASDEDLLYIVVTDREHVPVAWAAKPAAGLALDQVETRERLAAAHGGRGDGRADIVRANVHFKVAAADTSGEARLLGGLAGMSAPAGTDVASGTALATALVGMSTDVQLGRLRGVVGYTVVFAGVVVLSIVYLVFSWMFTRISRLTTYARQVAEGDLTHRVADAAGDEVGDLATALSLITENLGETISRMRVASLELDSVSSRVRDASDQIASDSQEQSTSVRRTNDAMELLTESARVMERQIHEASRAVELSTEKLTQISHAIEMVAAAMTQLGKAVQDGRAHLERSVASFAEVDTAVDRLNEAAESTAAATTEITMSIQSVQQSSAEALRMSGEAADQAESGVQAVKQTLDGSKKIRDFAHQSVESIRFLAGKVSSVSNIVDVINDIAGQTRLLSLNASIIAAQAGEHGKGFLVIADQVKSLTVKTAGSTQEIAGVIQEVLKVSEKVINLVESGIATVDEGVTRSEHADHVLSDILTSSTRASALVRGIALATSEQAQGAQRVNHAMQSVHATAVRLRDIVADRRVETQALQTAMSEMSKIMEEALTTARAQAAQAQQAIQAVGGIFAQIRGISDANREQAASQTEVAQAFRLVESLSKRYQSSAEGLLLTVEQVARQSQALAEGIRVFRI